MLKGFTFGAPLAGRMARLGRQDRRRLATIPAWARGALPVMIRADVDVGLPRPFGDGPAQTLSLAGPRLAGACGLIARESEIAGADDGACGLVTLCSEPSD